MTGEFDVFISYARNDRPAARRLAEILEAQGNRVWWDVNLAAGSVFSSEISKRIDEAKHVVVLWSKESTHSHFVQDEAERARKQGKILPVRIDDCDLPVGFGRLHTLQLIDWQSDIGALLSRINGNTRLAPTVSGAAAPVLDVPDKKPAAKSGEVIIQPARRPTAAAKVPVAVAPPRHDMLRPIATAPRAPMRFPSLRDITTEAKLLLIGIPVLLWSVIPVYHMVLFAISPKDSAFSGALFPAHPTTRNFETVFRQQHHYLDHFWEQMLNSTIIAVSTGVLTLIVATLAAFAISRLKVRGGQTVMNLALFTYFIPAAFLAVPMYRTMGLYGLLNHQSALILAMVTLASPYAIWVFKQASDKLPQELDEAAYIDGASPLQLFRLVYLPLMLPSLVAVGIYALLLAWNEYLYAFLLLSKDSDVTLGVGLGNFLSADDSPWELLMATGLVYAMPPAAIYYTFRRYMVSGLTAGATKG